MEQKVEQKVVQKSDIKKVCPIITAGWFASKWSAGKGMREDYIKCYKERCACWDVIKKRCGLVR